MAATNSTVWHFCGAVLAGIQGLLKVVKLQLLGLKLKIVIKAIQFYNPECSFSFSRNRKRRA